MRNICRSVEVGIVVVSQQLNNNSENQKTIGNLSYYFWRLILISACIEEFD